jgi:hypothetical protein
MKCHKCGKEYQQISDKDVRHFNGGILTVTDLACDKCECDSLINLGDGVIISLYADDLNKSEVLGDVTVSLNKLKERYHPHEIVDNVKKSVDTKRKMEWMKEKLGITTNEELFSKALSLLHMAIQLEERGYSIRALKDLGLLEGTEHVVFQIRQ